MNATSITATAPSSDTTGAKDVVVTTPSGRGTLSGGYTYVVLTWKFKTTYNAEITYIKYDWLLKETLSSGTGATLTWNNCYTTDGTSNWIVWCAGLTAW